MKGDFGRKSRPWVVVAWAVALLTPVGAVALPLTSLKDQGLDAAFGSYAPRGDCAREPRITLDETGFTFRADGRMLQSRRFERAFSYMGPSYEGISAVFFPFPVSNSNFGPVIMIVNADEKPGLIRLEADVAPGQRLDPFHGALTRAAPYLRCGGAAKAPPSRPADKAPSAPARASAPPDWGNLSSFVDDYSANIALFGAGPIAAAIRAQLGGKTTALQKNLSVATPLKRQGSAFYLSGNAPHQGGMEQAYVLLDTSRRAVQVGLWERGKLSVYSPPGRRLAPPADIQTLLNNSPREDAVAAPGTPWEVVPVQRRPPMAYVDVAASPNIKSFSLFCDNGRPMISMLLNRPSTRPSVTVTWNFAGGLVNIPMSRGNGEGTFWQANLTGSPLLPTLLRQSGPVYLRINGQMEGEASLVGASAAVRTALGSCQRF